MIFVDEASRDGKSASLKTTECYGLRRIDPYIALCFIRAENTEIFYLLHLIKFANSQFIFAIKGSKLAIRHEEIQNLNSTNRGKFLHLPFYGAIHGAIFPGLCKDM